MAECRKSLKELKQCDIFLDITCITTLTYCKESVMTFFKDFFTNAFKSNKYRL